MASVRDFLNAHFLHYNSRELVAAARAWEEHLARGGKMLVTLAGAMSTARIGKTLARMIRAGKVHAVCCTGANLEEDPFALVAADEYVPVPDWRALRAEDEEALLARGLNRVTDTCIPETVMRHLERRLLALWQRESAAGRSRLPSEYMKEVVLDPELEQHFSLPREESWLVAAAEHGVPVWTPGWEDSTTGNMFAGQVWKGALPDHRCVRSGTEQMTDLMRWYLDNQAGGDGIGFFQVGGGIAGDFAICSVPCLIQDLEMEDVRTWGYFAQISDAVTSYGGYSGAVPNEKITWGKLEASTPKFMIQSDATIVAPLIFAWLLGD
jgi:deoxyhypusine synthase